MFLRVPQINIPSRFSISVHSRFLIRENSHIKKGRLENQPVQIASTNEKKQFQYVVTRSFFLDPSALFI